MTPPAPVGVVVLTHRREAEVRRCCERLLALPERPPVVVVDNGSGGGIAARLRADFPAVDVVALPRNIGAAARNAGVARLATPFVAFCDDDCWWAAGSLARAAALLAAQPQVAVLSAEVRIGDDGRLDPACAQMAASPLPGRGLVGFMAGACVMRRDAFVAAGGYEPRLFIGSEEQLLAFDLLAAGWQLRYEDTLRVHHHPSPQRDPAARRRLLQRNGVWVALLRRPWSSVWRVLRHEAAGARADGRFGAWLLDVAAGLPWALARRRVVPPAVEALRRRVDGDPLPGPWPARDAAPQAASRRPGSR